ncbi:hypothetical protein [Chryseobacterium vrystaatense]|uniref:Lipoprotein n=1 Tax=Chryseobacterium vrystaatense TaxID=307480 RepID=A0ABR4UHW3_9FLAO|nr:hypothetical protein [Chryseobacterium vrystaatense]KFF24137.1 hypothetical protein IW16_22505 [Chryseobacterium vrystaatense]
MSGIKLLLLSLILCTSCSKKQKNTVREPYRNWGTLEIKTRYQTLTISKFSDSAEYYYITDSKGEFKTFTEPKYQAENDKQEKKKIFFTKAEKDSLSKYIYESVTQPKFTNVLATDYVGNVVLKLDTGNMNLVCEYYSVGDWTTVSENTKKIYDLISKKIKISKQ